MSRQNRRERFWITPWALARRAEGRMPESTTWMCVSDRAAIIAQSRRKNTGKFDSGELVDG